MRLVLMTFCFSPKFGKSGKGWTFQTGLLFFGKFALAPRVNQEGRGFHGSLPFCIGVIVLRLGRFQVNEFFNVN
jgi:hypothetical protein